MKDIEIKEAALEKNMNEVDLVKATAEQIRKDILKMTTRYGTGHSGGALSAAEIVASLYKVIMNYDPKNPTWEDRDRFILSKGHGCLVLYSMLSQVGYFDRALLKDFCNKYETTLGGHPEMKLPGIEANTGSLGHGIAVGMGIALAGRIDKKNYKVFVVTGDGELQEGSNWEAAMSAAHNKVDNLVVIVDRNRLQLGGPTDSISNLEPLADKWESFGWKVRVVDGHNVEELLNTLKEVPFSSGKPSVIIANTIKGKGVGIAENKVDWHYKALTKQQYEELKDIMGLEELENEC
jgi:transketolase